MSERILSNLLREWLEAWPSYRLLQNNDRNERAYQLVHTLIPSTLADLLLNDLDWFVTGSSGAGAIAWAPTITIKKSRNRKISSGLQITYFVSLDSERIYLSIGLGMLGGKRGAVNSKITKGQINDLRNRADDIFLSNADVVEELNSNERLTLGLLDLSSELAGGSKIPEAYEYSNILALCYRKSDIPNDSQLMADLSKFLKIFEKMQSSEIVQMTILNH